MIPDYERGVADAIQYIKTHAANWSTEQPTSYAERDPRGHFWVGLRADRVWSGELLTGSEQHRQWEIGFVTRAVIAGLSDAPEGRR